MAAVHRLTITEHTDNTTVIDQAAQQLHVTPSEIVRLLQISNERLRRQFGLKHGSLLIRDRSIRAEGLAGLLRVSESLELEIAPKFLGDSWQQWRSDFFVIATAARGGRMLPSERLQAGVGERDNLATLVARALINEYQQVQRRPLRTYRAAVWSDFALDGDSEPEEITRPSADGFEQTALKLSRQNPYGQRIRAAALALVPEVIDASTRAQLVRMAATLAPQALMLRTPPPRRVPNRYRQWQGVYDLSLQILAGFGINLDVSSNTTSPGYVLRTASAWEDFLLTACRLALPGITVAAQQKHPLGERNGEPFHVRPDLLIQMQPPLLADAKYKGRVDKKTTSTAADVYEALAFLTATGIDTIALLYPRPAREHDAPPDLGDTKLAETVTVGQYTIHALEIEMRGISQRNGMKILADRLGVTLRALNAAPLAAAP